MRTKKDGMQLNLLLVMIVMGICTQPVLAQNVGIGTNAPAPSAQLEAVLQNLFTTR